MSKSVPTVGDMVLYHVTQTDKNDMAPHGNIAEVLPAVVVADWGSNTVNLKVFTDGQGPDLWITSAMKGQSPGYWEWPYQYHNRMNS